MLFSITFVYYPRFYNVQNNKKKNGTPKCQSQETF
jgi:hypothetical protein